MSFRQGKSSSEKRCKCTHKICNEQIFFNIFFAKIMREKNRGKSVRMVGVRSARAGMGGVGAVGSASRTGRDGSGGKCEPHGQGWERWEQWEWWERWEVRAARAGMGMVGGVGGVVINRIINFGKGCSLISY